MVSPAIPSAPRRTRPNRRIWLATTLAVALDTAKHRPCAPWMTAVLMPTISPRAVTSGPPELPGFNAASVCSTSSIRRPGSGWLRSG
jgi:hypothetical protein